MSLLSNHKKFGKPKAGLLLIATGRFKNMGEGLSQGSYIERKEKEASDIINSLSDFIDIVNPGIIYTRQHLADAIKLFLSESPDFIIAEFLSWAEDFAWIRFLRDYPEVPVIFVNAVKDQLNFETTVDENDFVEFLSRGTLVGSLEASLSIAKIGNGRVKIVVGDRQTVNNEIIIFSKAAKTKSILKNATFGLLSGYNELMWATYLDPYDFFTKIGPEIRFLSYSTLADEINSVEESEVLDLKNELERNYKADDGIEDIKFRESVRASIGLARLTQKLGLDAMVLNDINKALFELIGLRPGFYHPLFEKNLSVMVPEGDLGGGLITFVLKMISGKHVNFIEPFHIETANKTFAAGHAGPNDYTDPEHLNKVVIANDVRFAKSDYKYAGAPFAWYRFPAGVMTMAQFTASQGSYKIIATLVECIDGDKHLFASYSHGIFTSQMPVTELFEKILKIGATQHFAVVKGDYLKELSCFAEIMQFEYYEIK